MFVQKFIFNVNPWSLFGNFRLVPRCKWDLRSSGVLLSIDWVTDVSGQPIRPAFKGNLIPTGCPETSLLPINSAYHPRRSKISITVTDLKMVSSITVLRQTNSLNVQVELLDEHTVHTFKQRHLWSSSLELCRDGASSAQFIRQWVIHNNGLWLSWKQTS